VEVALSVEEGALLRHDGLLLFVLNAALVARSLTGGPSTLLRANPRARASEPCERAAVSGDAQNRANSSGGARGSRRTST